MQILSTLSKHVSKSNSTFLAYLYNKIKIKVNPIHYVSMEKVAADTAKWCETLGSDFDIVVALPRSGMVVGATVACILGKSLSTPDEYIHGRQWASSSFERYGHQTDFYNKILIVDDSVVSGKQMDAAVSLIKTRYPGKEILVAALYVAEGVKVDRFYKTINTNHSWLCEYNLMHAKFGEIGYDVDGVICEDWDGKRDYVKFLREAKPYKIPIYDIDFLVTARKEMYRETTEQWLAANNVKYKQLFMAPNDCQDGIKFKAGVLLTTKPRLYVESSDYIARKLNSMSGCSVICIENNRFYK